MSAYEATQCDHWMPGVRRNDGAYRCLNLIDGTQCEGTWIEHAKFYAEGTETMPRMNTRLADYVGPDQCLHWRPWKDDADSTLLRCRTCGGDWEQHAKRTLSVKTPPTVEVKFKQISGVPPVSTNPVSACRAFHLASRGAHISQDVCDCGAKRDDHAPSLRLHQVAGQPEYEVTATWVEGQPEGRSVTTGIGQYDGQTVIFVGPTPPMLTLRDRLADDWSGRGINVWVPAKDIVWRNGNEPANAAVYIGPDLAIPGAKPTLVEGQGVFVIMQYANVTDPSADARGSVQHLATVIYDITDEKFMDCQWDLNTKITDVPTHNLIVNGNWRRHIPGDKYSSASHPSRHVTVAAVPQGPTDPFNPAPFDV